MNNTTVSGNLGKDPELRYFESGTHKASFTLAVYGGKKGDQVVTHWYNCEAWKDTAERIAAHCRKGDRILATGSMKMEQYEKDGQKRTIAILNVSEFGIIPKGDRSSTPSSDMDEPPVDPRDIPF